MSVEQPSPAPPPGSAARALRWLLVVPAGLLGWQAGVVPGALLQEAILQACAGGAPASCTGVTALAATAAWYLGVAVAAVLMVLLPVLTAPSMRGTVAWSAFALGLAVAGHDGWMEDAWGEMLVTALVGLVVLLLALRRWRGDGRAARPAGEERQA